VLCDDIVVVVVVWAAVLSGGGGLVVLIIEPRSERLAQSSRDFFSLFPFDLYTQKEGVDSSLF
jgi:hypothetical protein